MAEIEEAIEVIEEADAGIEAEADGAAEELDAEEAEELQEEANVARENVSTLRSVVDYIKSLEIPGALKTFTKFVVKNAAIGAIIFGVNILLSKAVKQTSASSGTDSQAAQDKYNKITALSTLIDDMTKTSQKTVEWLQEHEKDTISLEGIDVPLIDIFTKYTTPMGDSVEKAYDVAKDLQTTGSDGKATFNVPTTVQVTTIVESATDFVTAFDGFIKFAAEKESDYSQLKTLPVSQSDVDKLYVDLQTVKSLPYY